MLHRFDQNQAIIQLDELQHYSKSTVSLAETRVRGTILSEIPILYRHSLPYRMKRYWGRLHD